MDSSETEDQIIIVNRSKEHRVSKKLIRKIPYFEMMLRHDLLESNENKVVLDFDEDALSAILIGIELDCIFVEMNYVINLCNMADYFGINENLINHWITYFHTNFTVKDLPVIIPQVTPSSKFINSATLNTFLCRHFLKIVKSDDWNSYPIEVVAYICKLDLMIDSEMQVFNAIISWVNGEVDSRKYHFKELLKLVRWCHLKDEDLTKIKENKLFKYSDFEPKICSSGKEVCDCTWNRTKQNYFIAVEKLDDTDLRVKILDSNFLPLVNKVIKLDESLPLNFLHDEYVTDIAFDSGSKMIRIDWKHNKYLYIDIDFPRWKCYYLQDSDWSHDVQNVPKIKKETRISECRINCKYFDYIDQITLCKDNEKFEVGSLMHTGETHHWSLKIKSIKGHSSCGKFMATVLGKNIYILTKYCELIKFDIDQDKLQVTKLLEFKEGLKFDNLILTSNQVHEDRVFLIDKSKKEIFCFNINTHEWNSIGLLINYSCSMTDDQEEPKLLTFTSAFISMDTIRPDLKRKLSSIDDHTYAMGLCDC